MKRVQKLIITLLICLLLVAIGVSSLAGIFFYNLALDANYSKEIVYADRNGDKFLPYSMMNELYNATNSPKEN